MEDVTVRKMSQLRDGSLGRLESHDFGIPVYSRAERIPDFGGSVFIPASSAISVRGELVFGKKISEVAIRSDGRRDAD